MSRRSVPPDQSVKKALRTRPVFIVVRSLLAGDWGLWSQSTLQSFVSPSILLQNTSASSYKFCDAVSWVRYLLTSIPLRHTSTCYVCLDKPSGLTSRLQLRPYSAPLRLLYVPPIDPRPTHFFSSHSHPLIHPVRRIHLHEQSQIQPSFPVRYSDSIIL
jgi:hypothetical protein